MLGSRVTMAQPTESTLAPGTVLQDRYRIKREIGKGGMGAVYEAEHIGLGKRLAVKCLHEQFLRYDDVLERFKREALAAARIGHEHIIDVSDFGVTEEGSAFMVMEYLDGCDLHALISREGAQPLGRVIHIMSQICAALTAAHKVGIVHRDLKPGNIFLSERFGDPHFVKVIDFGISKFVETSDLAEGRLTMAGTALGTPWYMAPEQIEGRPDIDHRADIYALGGVLFNAATAKFPFDNKTFINLARAKFSKPAPDLRDVRPDVPDELADLCARLLARHAKDRPQTCEEVREALDQIRLTHLGPPPSGLRRRAKAAARAAASVEESAAAADRDVGTEVRPSQSLDFQDAIATGRAKSLVPPTIATGAEPDSGATAPHPPQPQRSAPTKDILPPKQSAIPTPMMSRVTDDAPTKRRGPLLAIGAVVIAVMVAGYFATRSPEASDADAPSVPAANAPAPAETPPPTEAVAPARSERVEITSLPAGATVRQDGVLLGNTPYQAIRPGDADGPVDLEIALRGFASETLRVLPDSPILIHVRLRPEEAAAAPTEPVDSEETRARRPAPRRAPAKTAPPMRSRMRSGAQPVNPWE